MNYRTILLHLSSSPGGEERLRLACRLAQAHDAHLVGVAATTPTVVMPPNILGRTAVVPPEDVDSLAASFAEQASRSGLRSSESRTVVDGDPAAALCVQARYCDLVIVGQTDPHDPHGQDRPGLAEQMLLNAGRPLLVVPYAGSFPTLGERPLVAWDSSREAARAATDALPLLRRAAPVRVITFNARPSQRGHGAEPGADVALFLARHGLQVEVEQERTELDIGNALLSRAADHACDLIVTGGYGHSRLREIVLGGVTRTLLGHMTVPVLMSH